MVATRAWVDASVWLVAGATVGAAACGKANELQPPDQVSAGGMAGAGKGGSSSGSSGSAGRAGSSTQGSGGRMGPAGNAGEGGEEQQTTGGSGGSSGGTGGGAGADAGAAGAAQATLLILPSVLPPARVGAAYSVELEVTGADSGDVTWSALAKLPSGLALASEDRTHAILSGTPQVAGPSSVLVSAENAGSHAERDYSLRVRALPWLLYTTDEGVYAEDLSDGLRHDPVPVSNALDTDETANIANEAPARATLSFNISTVSKQDLWITHFRGLSPAKSVRVNSPFSQSGGRVQGRDFSPDGMLLGYAATESYDDPYEAFITDLSGTAPSAPVKVNAALPSDATVQSVYFRPGLFLYSVFGTTVGSGGGEGTRLYSVDTSTFPPEAAVPETGWDAAYPVISPDGRRVSYVKQVDTAGTTWEAYAVGIRGAEPTEPVRLHPEVEAGEMLENGFWTRDSQTTFLLHWRANNTLSDVYRVRFDGGTPLPAERVTAGTGAISDHQISPDETKMVYVEDSVFGASDHEMWLIDVSGDTFGERERVDGPHVTNGGLYSLLGGARWGWSPDSRHVAYLADSLQDGVPEAFIVDVSAHPETPKRLNTSLPSVDSEVRDFYFSPSGDAIVLMGELETEGKSELFGVTLAEGVPGIPQKLNGPLSDTEIIGINAWSPDGTLFAYTVYDTDTSRARVEFVRFDGTDFSAPVVASDSDQNASNPIFLGAGF